MHFTSSAFSHPTISGFFFSFWPKGKRRGLSLCLAQMALSLVEHLCELSCIFFGMFHRSVQRGCPWSWLRIPISASFGVHAAVLGTTLRVRWVHTLCLHELLSVLHCPFQGALNFSPFPASPRAQVPCRLRSSISGRCPGPEAHGEMFLKLALAFVCSSGEHKGLCLTFPHHLQEVAKSMPFQLSFSLWSSLNAAGKEIVHLIFPA